MKISTLLAALTLVGAMQLAAMAQQPYERAAFFVQPSLPGTSQYDQWNSLTNVQYPGYGNHPATIPWPGPAVSNAPNSGDAGIVKLANGTGVSSYGPYIGSSSIYFSGISGLANNEGGRLAVQDSTPVANLKNVVFQFDIGGAYGYEFYNNVFPTLNYNAGTQNLAATQQLKLMTSETSGSNAAEVNTYLLQWDLSSIADAITSFSIEFNGVQHAQIFAAQLDQSDEFALYVVPEPATMAMAALSGVALVVGARRRRA